MSGPSAQADVECSEREQACTPEVAAPGAARPEAAEHEASAVGAEGPEAAERGVACSEAVGPGSAEPVRVTSGGVNQVTAKLRRAGTMLMCGGISSASLYFLIAAAFFWSSRVPLQDMSSDKEKAPEACNRDLESLFHWLGLWNGILGIVSALFACTAHELHNALTHSVLARKFRSQGRYEEALEQQEEYMDDIRCATRMVMVPSAFYILATEALWSRGSGASSSALVPTMDAPRASRSSGSCSSLTSARAASLSAALAGPASTSGAAGDAEATAAGQASVAVGGIEPAARLASSDLTPRSQHKF
eukprot:CAMPEP_0197899426 /NCGR_PEP_ID=MMETSP1439-20131203/46471_1 /TAXON_ID=66791 /ORGANISM="Gonyaulax spinifera, Strain CCMP409" /LENGTH=304 /DNA_ID=CAMNT_0043520227 /DNA_START=61 /DNA_END=974 /DNA_ORIENTATION=-